MAKTLILPAGFRYQAELAETAASLKACGKSPHLGTLDKATELVAQLESAIDKLEGAINHHASGDVLAHAKHFRDEVIPAMNVVRSIADKLETIIPDDIWPLPTYQEMLFIK
jgi:glutamine synthetase